MATEFNYVVNVDTTRVMGAMSEVRSQMGMALGGVPSQFAPTGPMAQMMAGLESRAGSILGRTHTDPGMAYNPHYGQVHATTTAEQEAAVARHGLAAAEAMRPPGVSAYEYAAGVHENAIERQQQARNAARNAAQSTFLSGAGGLAAGEAAFAGASLVGGALGARVGARLFGGGLGGAAAGAGRFLGGMGLGIMAFGMAEEYVGGKIRDHYAEIERVSGVTNELADIVGGGRNLTRTQRYETGIAAREAARDINMDVQQMGTIASLARHTGLLPSTTDPTKLREQLGNLAKAVDEGASALHTSLGNAAMVIRSAAKQGLSAEEGILRAGAAGGAEQYLAAQSRYEAFGRQGAQFALSQRLTEQQGFAMFTGALGQAAGAGISPEQMKVLGGRYGAAQLIGGAQIASAMSPLGELQLMAGTGGEALGGMMDMPGQALAAMSGGEGLMTNMMRFQVYKDDLRRGIGAKGIRTMARQQMQMGADMLESLGMGGSNKERMAFWAQSQMGMNPTQALAYAGAMGAGGGGGGPGGGGAGGEAYARRLDTFQNMQMHRAGLAALGAFDPKSAADYTEGYGFGSGYALEGGMTGFMVGGPKGAVIGAAAGLVAGNAKAAWNFGKDLFDTGPGLFASAQEKADYYNRRDAAEYDAKVSAFKERYGSIDINMDVAARVRSAPLRRVQLDASTSMSSAALSRYTGVMSVLNLSPVEAGPGTLGIGDRSLNIRDLRERAKMADAPAIVTDKVKDIAYKLVVENPNKELNEARKEYKRAFTQLAEDDFHAPDRIPEGEKAEYIAEKRRDAIKRLNQSAGVMVKAAGDAGINADYRIAGAVGPKVRGLAGELLGGWEAPKLHAQMRTDITLAASLAEEEGAAQQRMVNYILRASGERGMAAGGSPAGRMTDEELRSEYDLLTQGEQYRGTRVLGKYPGDTFEEFKKRFPRGVQGELTERISKGGMKAVKDVDQMLLGDFVPGIAEEYAESGSYEKAIASFSEKIAGRSRGSRNLAMGGTDVRYVNEALSDPAIRKAIASGDVDLIKKGMGRIARKEEYEGVDAAKIIQTVTTGKMAPAELDGGNLLVGAVALADKLTEGAASKAIAGGALGSDIAEALTPVSLIGPKGNAGRWARNLYDMGTNPESEVAGKKKRPREAMAAHAIGFGQQESALTTINRALEKTHRMLGALEKDMMGRRGSAAGSGGNDSPASRGGAGGSGRPPGT